MREYRIVTIHPGLIEAYQGFGVFKQALEKEIADVRPVNLRDYAIDRRGSVDAPPFGGGDGMVLRAEPLAAAVRAVEPRPYVVLTSPAGKPLNQPLVEELAAITDRPVMIIAGRFAGVDQRFIDRYVDREIRVGEFVVAGGELPALMIVDAVLRLVPGVLGNPRSALEDSYAIGLARGIEYPLYTRPDTFEGVDVPWVLRSGDHGAIAEWRRRSIRGKAH